MKPTQPSKIAVIVFMCFFGTLAGFAQDWHDTGNSSTSSSTNFVGTTDSNPLRFCTNGNSNEHMRITSTGEVGIGTTSPVGGLDVAIASTYGDIVASRQGAYFAGNWPTAGMWQLGGGDVNGNIFLASSTTGDPTLLNIPYGCVGIGLTNPAITGTSGAALHINGPLRFSEVDTVSGSGNRTLMYALTPPYGSPGAMANDGFRMR